VSWNVNAPPTLSKGSSTNTSRVKNEQAEALRILQEQIRHEEQQKQQQQQPPQPQSQSQPQPQAPQQPQQYYPQVQHQPQLQQRVQLGSPEPVNEDEEKRLKDEIGLFQERRMRQEEDRLSKWTHGVGRQAVPVSKRLEAKSPEDKPTPSVLLRLVDHQPHGVNPVNHHHHSETPTPAEHHEPVPEPEVAKSEELKQAISRFTEHATAAAKALKHHRGGEALAKSCFTTISMAKSVATMTNDDDIFGWARALEGSTNMLRTRLDSGATGQEYFTEISNALGQLILSVIAL